MADATEKAPEINAFLSSVMGQDRVATIQNNRCMVCKGDANEFRDELSMREYRISGLCQRCQDSVFGP